ncbi:uncharacterized protein [Pyxicephalus adspersus]|uniref:uncharacterized protein n=1 Tax=Pyxicephalus adspersus TaxID=30357 RepID=UPI003B5C7A68
MGNIQDLLGNRQKIISAETEQKSRDVTPRATQSHPQEEGSQQLPDKMRPVAQPELTQLPRPLPTTQPRSLPTPLPRMGAPRDKATSSQVLVLSWESGHDVTNIITYLVAEQNCDCPCVALSSLTKDSEWTSLVDQSSAVIFYTTPKSQRPLYKMGRYLDYCINKKGPEKVIVIIGDADVLDDDWTAKWEENQFPKTLQQFHILPGELDFINRKKLLETIKKIGTSLIIHTGPPENPPGSLKFGTVGIFSRSSQSDYAWLKSLLESPKLQDVVNEVRSVCISNRGYVEFYEEVIHCHFGILYHTKKRGRVNITDDTNSLYDIEIEYLATVLGRYKVLVVIDDLQDSSWKEKERIWWSQPSIQKYSRNLFLVTEEEKKDEEKLLNKLMEVIVSPAVEEEGPVGNSQTLTDSTRHGTDMDTE